MNPTTLAEQYAQSLLDLARAEAHRILTPECGKPHLGFKEARKRNGIIARAQATHLAIVVAVSDWLDAQGATDGAVEAWRQARDAALMQIGLAPETDTRPIRPKKPWNRRLECGHIVRDKCEHYRDA